MTINAIFDVVQGKRELVRNPKSNIGPKLPAIPAITGAVPVHKEPAAVAPPTLAEEIISDWKDNPGIRAEFKNFGIYAAFRKAEAEGRVKIVGGTVIT